jgi:uncharacterized protein YjbI with pentapeptide repeats
MADPKQLKILKSGVENWNNFRKDNPTLKIDLSNADLSKVKINNANLVYADLVYSNLVYANLNGSDFSKASLSNANLCDANLIGTNFSRANLNDANLSGANLSTANLSRANLTKANFSQANLSHVKLRWAYLSEANFSGADLHKANLMQARFYFTIFLQSQLSEASFQDAHLNNTIFSNTNLSKTKFLESCIFYDKCFIDYHTLSKSGNLPVNFLRGCGLSETYIEYIPALFSKAIQFYSCFISYSSKDEEIAKKIHADLQDKGIRCWFAPEDLKIGDKFRSTIHEAIKVYDKLLLIISENSINSHWVEDEVEKAFEKERKQNRTVLFPITVDQNIFNIDVGWADSIKNTRHIGDFTNWKNHDSYKKAFDRLVRDLKQENLTAITKGNINTIVNGRSKTT